MDEKGDERGEGGPVNVCVNKRFPITIPLLYKGKQTLHAILRCALHYPWRGVRLGLRCLGYDGVGHRGISVVMLRPEDGRYYCPCRLPSCSRSCHRPDCRNTRCIYSGGADREGVAQADRQLRL